MNLEEFPSTIPVKLAHVPTLELGPRQGVTDYVDFLEAKELTCSIMKFQDVKKRCGLAVRIRHQDNEKKLCVGVLTFFQRYPSHQGRPQVWVTALGPGLRGRNSCDYLRAVNQQAIQVLLNILDAKDPHTLLDLD